MTAPESHAPAPSRRVAVVTGASSGIGAATARALAAAGYLVVAGARRLDRITALAAEIGGIGRALDVTDPESIAAFVAGLDRVDILVNNAGGAPYALAADSSSRLDDKILGLNLSAVLTVSKAANAVMQQQTEGGAIVNISSVNGEKGQSGQTNYSAAKAGMHGFSMALAQELATKGVTVNTVSPGYIGTDMVKAIRPDVLEKIVATVPVKRLGEPSEIASIIAWLASEEGGYATGADFSVNGGLHMG